MLHEQNSTTKPICLARRFQGVALVRRNRALLKGGIKAPEHHLQNSFDKSTQLNAVEQVETRLSDQKLA